MSPVDAAIAVVRLASLIEKMVRDGSDVQQAITRIETSYETQRQGDKTFAAKKAAKFGNKV
ncbi:MAG TPA: hypothetical protein VK524_03220 [Polyangiaceae bacterium]|nr:hypothetical protein [Polyangiaceae bacterium]